MFNSVTLQDFQSHQNTRLELGPFTVIVGSSSSGKSAVVRALRLVAENARGTTYVRQGAKSAKVTLEASRPGDVEPIVVSVERGKSISAYTLRMPGSHDEPMLFTKCASSVPEQVVEALGLGESRLWIAGQFDRPYLLDETGAEVARVLGKLTNVTMIYAAVRETNRRAAEARRMHSAKSAELAEAQAEIAKYATLPARLRAAESANDALARAEAAADRRSRLSARLHELDEAVARAMRARASVRAVPDVGRLSALSVARERLTSHLSEVRAADARRSSVRVRPVPDLEGIDTLRARRASLREALSAVARSDAARAEAADRVRTSTSAAEFAREKFTEAIHRAGSCPLCGAPAASAQIASVL